MRTLTAAALCGLLAAGSVSAKVSPDQAARLGKDLTPVGAEKAGNKDGSIPAWEGGLSKSPACFKPGGRYCDPFTDDKPLYTITAANVAQYEKLLTPGQRAMFQKHPSYKMQVFQSRSSGARAWTQGNVYGYPLAYLVFDPVEAIADRPEPTANPLDPQETCADLGGGPGTEVHGLVYSGGDVEFDGIALDGGVVAFRVQTRGSSTILRYSPIHGDATPPPGFPTVSGSRVVLLPKTFAYCVSYAADVLGGTACP
jgi:hypothetical protein